MSRKRKKKKPTEPAKSLGGRPPLYLDPEIRAKVLEGLELGIGYAKTAKWAGIDEDTLANWRKMEPPPNSPSEVVEFFGDLKKAEIGGEVSRIRTVVQGFPGWQGAAWWLERVKGYAKPQAAPLQDPKPVQVTVVDPADEPDPDDDQA